MGPLGMGEIVVIFVLALLIFGPKKLPELGKTFGKGMAEFKRASNELKTTFQREMDSIEHETKDVKTLAKDVSKDINTSYYDDSEDDYYSDYDYSGSPGKSSSSGDSAKASTEGDGDAGPEPSPQESSNGSPESPVDSGEAGASDSTSSQAAGSAPVSGLPDSEEVVASKSA